MGIGKTLKTWAQKALTSSSKTVSLQSQGIEDVRLFTLLGNDYRFGTQSKDFLLHAYGMNPYVFMVIDRICQRLVQIDKLLLNRNEQVIENPDFEALFRQPNSKENGAEYLYRAAATYLVAGECFIVRKQEAGEPDQYFVPINYNVIINENSEGEILSYWVTMFGNSKTYLPNEVLHIYKPDITFDTNHGFSTLRATRKTWESNNEVWASEASLHKNKGISGVLYSDGNRPITATEQEALQQKYDEEFSGANAFGKVKVSAAKLGYVQMGMNPTDLQSIETRWAHLRTVCAAYNVDSKLFNDPQASTYNNVAEAKRAMIIDAVIPLGEVILPAMVRFMSRSFFQSYSMVLDEDTILELQLSFEQKSARLGREVMQGIISKRQARTMLYPELVEELEEEGGNVIETNENISIEEVLALQERITNESITRENAIAILVALYGLTDETANQILG